MFNRWPVIEEENWEDEKSDGGKNLFGSDSERTSSDQPFTGDYCFVIGDDSTTDDELMFLENPSQQKSLTLPANQTPPSGQHKRSLSESKTFEMVKGHKQRYQDKLDMKLAMEVTAVHRQRNNSTTESTTSGVSSCESVLGKSVIK